MENQDLRSKVLLNLRSVTQSCKGGVPFERLQRDYRDLLGSTIPFRELGDYRDLLGSTIPFRELGYNSLEAFIRDIPDVISLKKASDGTLVAEGVPDASTAHIVSLVSRQKPDTRKKTFRKPPPHYGMRKTLSSRITFREGSRGCHSNYTAPPHQYLKSPKSKPSKPPATVQHSKPRVLLDQVPPSRKYEVAPRFLKLKEVKNGSTLELVSPPSNSSSSLLTSESFEAIPPPRAVARTLPTKPQPFESSRAAQLDAMESARSAKEFIEIYSEMNKIEPIYTTVLFGQKAKNKGYVSTLKLNDKSYRSYPDMKPTEAQAEEEAAKKAMADIKEKKEHLNVFPETPYSNAEEILTLLSRIEQIVCEKPSGMFDNGIIREYEHKFCESLPMCWPELLKQSSKVEAEEVSVQYGKVPDGLKIIVRPTKELSSGNQTPSSTSSKTEYVFEDLDTKTLKKTLVNMVIPKVPEFVIPNGNVWDVYITNVSGWFSARLLEYSDDFLALSNEMVEFYKLRSYPVKDVFEQQVYAACFDDPNVWHRVIAEEIKEDGLITCYFLDEGDFSYVKKENLQEMNPSFLKLPYQAIQLALDGLQEFEKFIKPEDLEEHLLGQTLIAEVKRWHRIPKFFPEVPGIHRTVYTVVLFDTSSGEDINLNEFFKKTVTESLICKLPTLSTASRGFLSYVTAEGLIYLRLTNPSECWIEQELDRLAHLFEEASAATSKIPLDTVCAAKYESGTWHRAVVSENLHISSDPELVEVFFVDYGHVGVVGKSEVCELEPVSELLASAPHQAVCCELLNALPSPKSQWTQAASTKLMELAPFNQELIIRVMKEGDGNTRAKVNLYKRNEDSNIISINDSLACNPSLFYEEPSSLPVKVPSVLPLRQQGCRKSSLKNSLSNVIPDVAMPAEEHMAKKLGTSVSAENIEWLNTPDNIKSPNAFEVQSPVSLSLPVVPEIGKCFDVFVTMAAHPHNFVVQPFACCSDLDYLMKEMQSFYSTDENLLEMDFSMLQKNQFYAALHTDNAWYRVRIEQIIAANPVMVAVHYVDFGDFNTVSIAKLQPLYQKFKVLPCLAIKASLAGIKPPDTDWDPVHCVTFQEMVTEKAFVSVIHKKNYVFKDDIPSLSLELTLVDTTDTSKDVYIHELLIEKNIAKPQ